MPRRISRGGAILHRFHLICAVAVAVVVGSIAAQAQTEPSAPPDASTPLQANATPAGAGSVPTETTSSTYKLQPYDLIDVDVYSEADLHKPARLGSDGTVLLPLIGSVKVGGLTVSEATDLIRKRYGDGFVKNPSVLITVLQYRKSTFSILGQVNRPGIYEIPEGTNISILEAISLAGGFGTMAVQNSVTVKRTVGGQPTTLKVRAGDMAQDPNTTTFDVLPGDSIIVPSTQYKKSNFSILGQIAKPGLYDIPDGAHITIIDAISMAGGYTPTASQNAINIKRVADGKLVIITVKASDMVEDPNVVPFEVMPGDIIQVPYRTSTFSILGQVNKPGIYEIPEGTHLNIIDAILLAGGYTRLAAQNSVLVKRMVAGKPTSFKVKAGEMAEDANVVPFEVLPGDIVKVNESWY